MKKSISLATMTLLFGFLGNSSATEGMYVGGSIGLSTILDADQTYKADPGYVILGSTTSETSFDHGLAINASLGYEYANNVRIEGEIGYQKSDLDEITAGGTTVDASSEDVKTWSFLANMYYDFKNSSPFSSYLSAGLGYANVEIGNEDDNVPIAQLGVGVGYALSEKVIIDLKYRYLIAITDPEFHYPALHVSVESEFASHIVMLGMRVGF